MRDFPSHVNPPMKAGSKVFELRTYKCQPKFFADFIKYELLKACYFEAFFIAAAQFFLAYT